MISEVERWPAYLNGIRNELQLLYKGKTIYEGIAGIVQSNKTIQKPSYFHRWVINNHGIALAMGLRRHSDEDNRSRSLLNLLKSMRCNVRHIPLENAREFIAFKTLRDNQIPGELERMLDADILKLRDAMKPIRKFVNKRIAHTSVEGKWSSPEIKTLHQMLNDMDKIVCRCSILLEGSENSIEVSIQDDWQSIFKRPWIEPEADC